MFEGNLEKHALRNLKIKIKWGEREGGGEGEGGYSLMVEVSYKCGTMSYECSC